MLALFYDTETTGLPLFNQPSDDERQPHIVQVGALLVDTEKRKVAAQIDLIGQPMGWEIPKEASDIHGITQEHAERVGLPEPFLLQALWVLWERADVRIGHNESFDARIIRIALKRHFDEEGLEAPPWDIWKGGKAECTAQLAQPLMKMPATDKMRAAGRNGSKKPKLTEAYEYFIGRPLQGAHSAIIDAVAAMDVWFAIQDIKKAAANDEPLTPPPENNPSKDDGLDFLQ